MGGHVLGPGQLPRPLWGEGVNVLLKLSRGIDWFNSQLAVVANWLVLLAAVISAGNAASRYVFSESSNGWLEIQWYMFAGMVLLGAPYTLKMNEHVRVDLFYGMFASERTQIWIDIICGVLFLLPICVILVYFTWPWFVEFLEHQRSFVECGRADPLAGETSVAGRLYAYGVSRRF